ncbi:MAG: DUF192 domain-containing protein [Methanobrevibacter sp.]
MAIKNLKIYNKEDTINIEVKICNSFLKRFKGLMLKNKIEYPLLFIIPKNYILKAKIHSFFMRIPIDIIFIDNENKIFEICSLKPWKFYKPKKESKYILELEYGFIKKNNIKIGSKILIKNLNNKQN